MDRTDYWVLLSSVDLTTPTGLFRVRRDATGLFIESWAGGDTWTDGPYTLGRYVYDGEPGADKIDESRVEAVKAQLAA
jgi:hypothetical protein